MTELGAVLAHARSVPTEQRAALGEWLRANAPVGSVLVETCHRVEIYAPARLLSPIAARASGGEFLSGEAVARHLVRLAVGLDSAIVAEDQVLHQLRAAVQAARGSTTLTPELDRLCDLAQHAGRRARSWMPHRRPSLADLALRRVADSGARGPVLVIGAGDMGRAAAASVARRGWPVMIASRTPERAVALAATLNAQSVPFDPGARTIDHAAGVLIALAGPWDIADDSRAAVAEARSWVVDLSAPPAIDAALAAALGERLLSVDDLARHEPKTELGALSGTLLRRLDGLVEQTLAEYRNWSKHGAQRSAAAALSRRAQSLQSAELQRLWGRLRLDDEQRAEVERMAQHLTRSLLRDPLERLAEDGDGKQAQAARELFRL